MDAMPGAPSNKATSGGCVEPENISYCRKFLNVARNFKQQQSMSAGPLNITQQITVPLGPSPQGTPQRSCVRCKVQSVQSLAKLQF